MNWCCSSSKGGDMTMIPEKLQVITRRIITENIPYTADGQDLMVCCPVGNQVKFKKRKADIALSGYCTAPNAALAYFQDPETDGTVEFVRYPHNEKRGY